MQYKLCTFLDISACSLFPALNLCLWLLCFKIQCNVSFLITVYARSWKFTFWVQCFYSWKLKVIKELQISFKHFFWGREREVEERVTTAAGRRVQCLVLEDLSPLRMTRAWGRQLYARCLEKKLNLFCVMHSKAKFHSLFRFGTPAAISRAVGIATVEKI